MRSLGQGVFATVAFAIVAGFGCQRNNDSNVVLAINSTCSTAELAEVTQLSVNVYGIDPVSQSLCVLGKRCIPRVDMPMTTDAIASALSDQKQPLVDVELAQAGWIEVVGHQQSCLAFDDHVMCGLGDLQAVDNNELAISLTCGLCDSVERPFCP